LRWLVVVLLCLTAPCVTAAGRSPVAVTSADDIAEPTFQSVGAGIIPRDVVPSIAQDRAGFLWVATGDGLMRYDGYRFHHQERDGPDPAARNLGWIRAMIPARDGRLWIGTEVHGLAAYEPATDKVVAYRPPGSSTDPLPTITALAEDRDGAVWVGTNGAGLQRFDPAQASFTHHDGQLKQPGLADDRVSALLVDRSGSLWVGTWQGLHRRRPGTEGFDPVSLGTSKTGVARVARALFQASDGWIWVGTADGVVLRIEPGSSLAREVRSSHGDAGSGAVTSLAEAPNDRLWVGRTTGIDQHDVKTGQLLRQVRHDARRHQGLAGNEVTSLLLDRAGSMWVAGFGLGLQRHEPGGAIRFRGADLDPRSPLHVADTRAILQLQSGEVWAALHQSGVVALDQLLRARASIVPVTGNAGTLDVTAMAQASDGSVWLGGEGRLEQYAPTGRRLRVLLHGGGGLNHIAAGEDRRLWICTEDGLYLLRPGAGEVTRVLQANDKPLNGQVFMSTTGPDSSLWVASAQGLYTIAPGEEVLRAVEAQPGAELGSLVVIGLLFDRRGLLWLDTAVSGLHRMTAWDGRRAQFDRVSARHGVFNRPFGVNLLEDGFGRIWTHMYVYDPRKDAMHELSAADGVIFGTGWFRSYAKLPDGRMLFGGAKGILAVDAERFQPGAYVPPLVISEIRLNGVRKHMGSLARGVDVKPDQRSLSIEFAALEFLQPGRNRYAYRLEGFDPQWISTGAEARLAAYSNLEPGDYTLHVRSVNGDGVWSPNELSMPVRVMPWWWQQAWFKAVVVVLLAGGVTGIVQLRTRLLRREQAELQAAVSARTTELEAARAGLEQRVEERTRELSLATRDAEEANRAKTSFLLNMSHEMRTPLNAILGLTHLQRRSSKDDAERDRLGKVENAAQHLLGVINDVLDFSKMEAGKQALAEAPFELKSLLDGLKDMLAQSAADKRLALLFEMDSRLEGLPPLLGDRQRIAGILLNFAGNAMKFTEQGCVRVSVVLLDEQDAAVSLRFDVEDTGSGIAVQTQARLFNAFEQADGPLSRRYGGAGLGLAISRRWAEMMQGTVGLSSWPGKGSRFWFAVTLSKASERCGEPVKPAAELPATYRGQRVLLVEDDPVNQIVAAAMLEGQGLVVDVAGDGAAAIRMANSEAYGLILMDIQMPVVDGLEATRVIRSAGSDRGVPIVGLTAFTSDEDRLRCTQVGMNDHLGKPVVPAKLFEAVQRWMRLLPQGGIEPASSD
jgi:signal transduction histidine kinase/ligand-binding sensor domain-containing protein/ActR/RegA family two-component response regulator